MGLMITVLATLLSPFLLLAIYIIVDEVRNYLKLSFYRKQGVKVEYIPILGVFAKFMRDKHNKDPNYRLQRFYEANYCPSGQKLSGGKDSMLVVNGSQPTILLLGSEIIKEFFAKEHNHVKRNKLSASTLPVSKRSFFYSNGDTAIKNRAPFKNFFTISNIRKLTPDIERCYNENYNQVLQQYREEFGPSSREWKTIDLAENLRQIFNSMVNQILLGEPDLSKIPKWEGKYFSDLMADLVSCVMRISSSPSFILSKGLVHKLGLHPLSRKLPALESKLYDLCKQYCLSRSQESPSTKRNLNLLDILLELNCKAKREGRIEDVLDELDIFENFRIFQVAGSETSRVSSGSIIHVISRNPAIRQKVEESLRELKTHEDGSVDYDSSPYLNAFFVEALRRYGPASFIFIRECVTPFTLAGVKISKGTRFLVAQAGHHLNSQIFDRPLEFNPDRLKHDKEIDRNAKPVRLVTEEELKEKKKNGEFMPFGLGARACIGAEFAELVIKIGLKSLLDRFELSSEGLDDGKWIQIFSLERKTVEVKLRPRK